MFLLLIGLIIRAQVVGAVCLQPSSRYEVRNARAVFVTTQVGGPEQVEFIETRDISNFSPFPPRHECSRFVYAHDQNRVFLNGKAIAGADAMGFVVEEIDEAYGHDRQHAFWQGQVINEARGAEFRAIVPDYAKDSKRAFFQNLLIPEANASTLHALKGGLVADDLRVFFQTEAFNLSEYKSFGAYIRLGKRVLYHNKELKSVHGESFEALGDCFGKDRTTSFVQASPFFELNFKATKVPEKNSALEKACRSREGMCCVLDDINLHALVRDSDQAELKRLKIPLKDLQVGPKGVLQNGKLKYRHLRKP